MNTELKKQADTPRTDKAAIGFARVFVDREKFEVTEIIPSDFARQLEREVQALKTQVSMDTETITRIQNAGYACEVRVKELEALLEKQYKLKET